MPLFSRYFSLRIGNQVHHVFIGISFFKMGDHDHAIADLSMVLRLNPDHVNAAFARAACYNKMGMLSQAIEDYNMALFKDEAINSPDTKRGIMESPLPNPTFFSPGNSVVAEGKSRRFESFDASGMFSLYEGGLSNGARKLSEFTSVNSSPEKTRASRSNSMNGSESNNGGYSFRSFSELKYNADSSSAGDNNIKRFSSSSRKDQFHGVSDSFSSESTSKSSLLQSPLKVIPSSSSILAPSHSRSNDIIVKADEFHAKGFDLRKQGDYKGAIEEYSQALSLNPNHFKALFNRGFAFDKIGRYDNAVEDYSRALSIDRNNAFCYYNRGITFDHMNKLQLSVTDFSKAIELQPDNIDFYHNRAYCLKKMSQLPSAIKDYTTILKLTNNSNFKALFNRSLCYEQINQLSPSLEDINNAIALQPNHPGCYAHRGLICEKSNQLNNAISDFTQALQCGSQIVPTLHSRAKIYAKLGQYPKAIADLTRIIETSKPPKDINVLFSRGMCYKSINQFNLAIEDFCQVLSQDPNQVLVYNYRGYCYRKLELNEEAIMDYSVAIKLSPNNIRAFNNRAFLFAKLNRFEEAINDYTKVTELDPNNSHAYHNRGISFDKLGMIDQAIADFSKVFELDSAHHSVRNLSSNEHETSNSNADDGRLLLTLQDSASKIRSSEELDNGSVSSGAKYNGNVSLLQTTNRFNDTTSVSTSKITNQKNSYSYYNSASEARSKASLTGEVSENSRYIAETRGTAERFRSESGGLQKDASSASFQRVSKGIDEEPQSTNLPERHNTSEQTTSKICLSGRGEEDSSSALLPSRSRSSSSLSAVPHKTEDKSNKSKLLAQRFTAFKANQTAFENDGGSAVILTAPSPTPSSTLPTSAAAHTASLPLKRPSLFRNPVPHDSSLHSETTYGSGPQTTSAAMKTQSFLAMIKVEGTTAEPQSKPSLPAGRFSRPNIYSTDG
jgi:tetratricopeptide (TPR) repeat protein